MEWQPIETAPREYFESILLYTDMGIVEGFWDEDEKRWDQIPISGDGNGVTYFKKDPTHWMPLPPTPNQSAPSPE